VISDSVVLAFRREVAVSPASDGDAIIEAPWVRLTLRGLPPGFLATLRALASEGATEHDLAHLALNDGDPTSLPRLYSYLECWAQQQLLSYSVVRAGKPLAMVIPMVPSFRLLAGPIGRDARFLLSRFTYLRREESVLVLESPLSVARTTLFGPTGAALVATLSEPRSAAEVCGIHAGPGEEIVGSLLRLLASAGVIVDVDTDGSVPEDRSLPLRQWQFHDLLFHARSRLGRHDAPFGGTFRFLGEIPPLPALKPPQGDLVVPLYRPSLDRLIEDDIPLTRALEERRSIREFGTPPMSAQQLGEFLYRVARVREVIPLDPDRSLLYEASRRPYPSGGATYDLEVYVSVDRCTGLASGLYHYDPLAHQLERISERTAHVEALLRDAQRSAGLAELPQVLITLASRFQRLSWKYESIAYATTLKNVGVLYQTMYLVATAMELASCALGGGDADRFAAAVGTDYYAETSVGEFLLGSRA